MEEPKPILRIPIKVFKTNHRFHIGNFQNEDDWDGFTLEQLQEPKIDNPYMPQRVHEPKIKCYSAIAKQKNYYYVGKLAEQVNEKYMSLRYKNGAYYAVPLSNRYIFNKVHQETLSCQIENAIQGKPEKTNNSNLKKILKPKKTIRPQTNEEESPEEEEQVSYPEEKEEEEEIKTTKKRAPKKAPKPKPIEEEEGSESESSKNESENAEPIKFGKGTTQLSEEGKKLQEILNKEESDDDDDEELFEDACMYDHQQSSDELSDDDEDKELADPRPTKIQKKEEKI